MVAKARSPSLARLVLATALLLPATAWAGSYLWVQTSVGQEAVLPLVLGELRDGALTTRTIAWGPDPRHVEVLDVLVRDRNGKVAIAAGYLTGRVQLGGLPSLVTLTDLRADDFELNLGWDAEGTFNLKGALRVPKPPDPDKEKRPPPEVALEGIALHRGRLTLSWPTWGLRFERIDAAGRVALGGEDPLVIAADLTSGPSAAQVGEQPEAGRAKAVRIDGFVWERGGFRVDALHLTGHGEGGRVQLAGGMGFGDDTTLDARGELVLGSDDVGPFLARVVPEGVTITELKAALEAGTWKLEASRLASPDLRAGPVRFVDVSLPVDAELSKGALLPRGHLRTAGVRAARVEGPENIRADAVVIERVDATLDTMADVRLDGAAAAGVVLPAGRLGKLTATATAKVGLAGGELSAEAATDHGKVSATGHLDVSVLRKRGELTLDATFEAIDGALAGTLGEALPDAVRTELGLPVGGTASFLGEVARGDADAWELGFELERAELRGAGGAARSYVDGAWAPPPPPEPR